MIKKTKNYDMFILRGDNREKGVDKNHVKKLVESIKSRNLLELRAITINEKNEVLDGQHRLEAAKILGVDIYYEICENMKSEDIIVMNIAKPWGLNDYLNYYCKNGFKEYKKLNDFMKSQKLSIKISMMITSSHTEEDREKFKSGKYIFPQDNSTKLIEICWDTVNMIKRMNGYSAYTSSARFWKALLKLVEYPDFSLKKWLDNLKKMSERMCAKANQKDYYKMMMDIYNWRNENKIDLLQE